MVQTEGLVAYESRKELDIPIDKLNIAEKERFMNGKITNFNLIRLKL